MGRLWFDTTNKFNSHRPRTNNKRHNSYISWYLKHGEWTIFIRLILWNGHQLKIIYSEKIERSRDGIHYMGCCLGLYRYTYWIIIDIIMFLGMVLHIWFFQDIGGHPKSRRCRVSNAWNQSRFWITYVENVPGDSCLLKNYILIYRQLGYCCRLVYFIIGFCPSFLLESYWLIKRKNHMGLAFLVKIISKISKINQNFV